MTSEHRQERVVSLIKDISGSFFRTEAENGIMVSVTDVKLSKDGKEAKILVSVFPEERQEEIVNKLGHKLGELRQELIKKTKMGTPPHLEINIGKIDF